MVVNTSTTTHAILLVLFAAVSFTIDGSDDNELLFIIH